MVNLTAKGRPDGRRYRSRAHPKIRTPWRHAQIGTELTPAQILARQRLVRVLFPGELRERLTRKKDGRT